MNKRIFLSPPYMFGNERELVDEAFASNYIAPCGPMVERFERALSALTTVPSVCALSSCTAALDLLFHELGVGSGDTVFCSSLTFVASIAPAVHRGAKPVFIGSDSESWTISPALLAEALEDARLAGALPKAVVAVDLYGQCCDYDAVEKVCEEYKVPLIVDSAEALGAVYCGHTVAAMGSVKGESHTVAAMGSVKGEGHTVAAMGSVKGEGRTVAAMGSVKGNDYSAASAFAAKECRRAGDAGWAGVYSFNGNKIITSSGGGALFSRDEDVVARALKRAQQSRENKIWYEHSQAGFNYRMSNIVAAIGLGQLMNLDTVIERKRAIFDSYRERLAALPGVCFMPEAEYGRCTRWLTVMTLSGDAPQNYEPSETVLKVIDALERENIESRPVWKPMHLQPVFKGCRIYGGEFDRDLFARGICLPSGTGLTDVEIDRVSEIVKKVVS